MIQQLFGEGKEFKLNVRKIQEQLVKKALECHIASINGRIEACLRCPIECTNPPGFLPAPAFKEDGKSERLAGIPTLAPLAKIPFYPSVSERFGFASRPDAQRIADKRKRALQVIEDRIQVTERGIRDARSANQAERDELRVQRESLQKQHDDMKLGMHDVYSDLANTETLLARVTGERDEARVEEEQLRRERDAAKEGARELPGVQKELQRVSRALEAASTTLEEQKSGAADWKQQFESVSKELFTSGQKLDEATQRAALNETAQGKLDDLQSEVNVIRAAMEHPDSGEFKGADFATFVNDQRSSINTLQDDLQTMTTERDAVAGQRDTAVAEKESAASALQAAQAQALTDAGNVRADRLKLQDQIAELQRNLQEGVGDKAELADQIIKLNQELETVKAKLETQEEQQAKLELLQQQALEVSAATLTAEQYTVGPGVPKRSPEPMGRQGEPSVVGTPEDALAARTQALSVPGVSSAERMHGTVAVASQRLEESSSSQPLRQQLFSDPPSPAPVPSSPPPVPTRPPPVPASPPPLPSPRSAELQIAARAARARELEALDDPAMVDLTGDDPEPKAAEKPEEDPKTDEEEETDEEAEAEKAEKPEAVPDAGLELAKILAKRANSATQAQRTDWVKKPAGFWGKGAYSKEKNKIPWPDQATNPLPEWALLAIYNPGEDDEGKRYRDKKASFGKTIFRKNVKGLENWVSHIKDLLEDENRDWMFHVPEAESEPEAEKDASPRMKPKKKPLKPLSPLSRRVAAPPHHVPGAVELSARLHHPTPGAETLLPRKRKKKKPHGSPGDDQPRLAIKKGKVMSVSRGAARRKGRTSRSRS